MQNPLNDTIKTSLENLREMIDVNTIIGDPIITNNSDTIIPISKVTFGFATGGGDYDKNPKVKTEDIDRINGFAGGSGAGVSVTPVAFLVINQNNIKLIPVDMNNTLDRVVEMVPRAINEIRDILSNVNKNAKNNTNTKPNN